MEDLCKFQFTLLSAMPPINVKSYNKTVYTRAYFSFRLKDI